MLSVSSYRFRLSPGRKYCSISENLKYSALFLRLWDQPRFTCCLLRSVQVLFVKIEGHTDPLGMIDLEVCLSNFGMVASTTWPFQEPSFDHLHEQWCRAPELFMAGSLQAVGSEQRMVFEAPLSEDIKTLLGPAVDVWAFGILLSVFPAPFSLGSHPFFSTFPKEVEQSWHVVSSLFAWLGVPVGDTAFLRQARERVPRNAGSTPLSGCRVSDVLKQVFVYEGRPTMQNIVQCLPSYCFF